MSRDQAIGAALLVGGIAGIIVYGWILFTPFWDVLLKLTGFVAVALVLGIVAWIGYTLATTPPPKPIEEIEKEVEKEIGKEEVPPPPPSEGEQAGEGEAK